MIVDFFIIIVVMIRNKITLVLHYQRRTGLDAFPPVRSIQHTQTGTLGFWYRISHSAPGVTRRAAQSGDLTPLPSQIQREKEPSASSVGKSKSGSSVGEFGAIVKSSAFPSVAELMQDESDGLQSDDWRGYCNFEWIGVACLKLLVLMVHVHKACIVTCI